MKHKMAAIDLFLRPLPCHDAKWLRVDLSSDLRSVEDLAVLWNNLIQDSELVSSPLPPVVNTSGNFAYLGDDGKHYCGTEMLDCGCCSGYCGPLSNCNCSSCRLLDSDGVIKRTQNSAQNSSNQITSNEMIENWLWGPIQNIEQKTACLNALLNELRDISLQAAGSCLFFMHLRQQLYIYERYFIALSRCKNNLVVMKKQTIDGKNEKLLSSKYKTNESTTATSANATNPVANTTDIVKSSENATLGLARVGTRAALNFSFAFLRRAWRSGEDMELCSELLTEALEALQILPEASLFDTSQVSQLWIEVLERSIKFLRQVVLGDIMGGRCTVPRDDRHTALSLLLELESQKGTLGASLEGIVLLLMLWQKETNTNDNRALPNNNGAPLASILKRYSRISNYGMINTTNEHYSPSATETFLRFLTLPDQDTAIVDLKQAAVVIVSHLDRLAKPHIPINTMSTLNMKPQQQQQQQHSNDNVTEQRQEQYVFALGWTTLLNSSDTTIRFKNSTSSLQLNQPLLAPTLEFSFQVKQIAFTEIAIIILSQAGNAFYLKTNKPDIDPIQIDAFGGSHITKLSAQSVVKHFLALDFDGKVYYAEDVDTKLHTLPSIVNGLTDKNVCNIYCGRYINAAITTNGEVYTFNRDNNYAQRSQRQIDSTQDNLIPTLVHVLKSYKIIDLALGTTASSGCLALTNEGVVYIWTYGNTQFPLMQLQSLPRIQRIFVAPQINVALTIDGTIYTWGSMNQLGQDVQDKNDIPEGRHIDCEPAIVAALKGINIVDVAVGSAHCLALSSSGEVYGWGRNDNQQICPQSISKDPIITVPIQITPPTVRISGIACGLSFSIIWCQRSVLRVGTRVPFVIDLTEHTFRLLDQLLGMVCSQEGRQTPSQESECIAVACLNLLRLQLQALIANNYPAKNVGLAEGSRLLASLKTRILNLAGGSCVLKTIQEAAQWALQIGWSILLPTASERAKTLTSLLPSEPSISTSGHRFMTDLLVGSLMAEGGLEIALNQVINAESDECPNNGQNLPLLHLIKQLLRNNTALTQARFTQLLLTDPTHIKSTDDNFLHNTEQTSPSLDLLHKFQRLLLSHIYSAKNDDVSGAEALLTKYVQHMVSLCITSLQKSYEAALQGKPGVIDILSSDISDTLLYELLIGLVLLHRDRPTLLSGFDWIKNFVPLLHSLDHLNRVIGNSDIQDYDDMGWPGIICRGNQKIISSHEDVPLIRKSDFENHIVDNGKWIIYNGYVYDIQNYRSDNQATNDLLQNGIGKDLTLDLNVQAHRQTLDYITLHLKVGKYGTSNVEEEKAIYYQNRTLSHFSSERTLAYLLGLRAGILLNGLPLQPAEIQCKKLLKSFILSGGLQTLQPTNPFDDEKSEARSSTSTAGSTPTTDQTNQIPTCDVIHSSNLQQQNKTNWPYIIVLQKIEYFLNGLGEGKLNDQYVITWITISERYCKENNLIWHQEFPAEHPIQEFERLLAAVLIRHQNFGIIILSIIDMELNGLLIHEKLPKQITEIIRIVYQTKWNLIKMRQQLNRSYKEVCAPLLERLRFLLYEVRPVISYEQSGLRNLSILHKTSRFKSIAKRIIIDMRMNKKQLACAKPEDILNVTIQSQNTAQMKLSQENLCRSTNVVDKITPNDNDNDDNDNTIKEQQQQHQSTNHNFEKHKDTDEYIKLKQCHRHNNNSNNISSYSNDCDYKEINNTIMSLIIDFVMNEICDVETLRRAMYWQVQRYQIRKQGLEMFNELLKENDLLDAVKYNMLNGYLGLNMNRPKHNIRNVLDDLNMITAFQKANIILLHSKILEWSIDELQKLVNQETILPSFKIKSSSYGIRDNSNFGTYVILKRSPRARFLLSTFGILARNLGKNELNLIINSGVLGMILGLLKQICGGGDNYLLSKRLLSNELCVVYEDTILKEKSHKANLTGPELAKLMKIGTRICRGADWKWGEQDGTPPGEGRIISEVGDDGWVRVEWDTGATNSYRMGKEGEYDLRLADGVSNITSPDIESNNNNNANGTNNGSSNNKDEQLMLLTNDIQLQLNGESHPSKLLRYTCIKLLQLITIGTGIYSDEMDKTSVLGIISMFRDIINNKITFVNLTGYQFDIWTTIGFLRAIVGNSKIMSKYLTTNLWIKLYINILELPIIHDNDVYKKVHCLKLLQTVLINWDMNMNSNNMNMNNTRCYDLIKQLFLLLGKMTLYCLNDLSIKQQNSLIDKKPRVLLTASHCGTVAEEIIVLLRRLHVLPIWNTIINSFISQKLCVAADLLGECYVDINNLENERILSYGVLITIGGYDPRPRIGLQIAHDINNTLEAYICGFTQKGKCQLSILHDANNMMMINSEQNKISIQAANNSAEHIQFNLTKVPINEMLLNSWAVLLYGPGERKESIPSTIDIHLLRSQQIQLAVLSANTVLYRKQDLLRNILKQRSPCFPHYSSDESLSDVDEQQMQDEQMQDDENHKIHSNNMKVNDEKTTNDNSNELLIQSILTRATQPSPIKASYTYQELALAALNLTQLLACHANSDCNSMQQTASQRCPSRPVLATMVHGVPVYNNTMNEASSSSTHHHHHHHHQEATSTTTATNLQIRNSNKSKTTSPSPLVSQIMEMGFSRKSVETAIKALTTQNDGFTTPEQIVQWILEHPDTCSSTTSSRSLDFNLESMQDETKSNVESDCESNDSNDTVEGSLPQEQCNNGIKYATRSNFLSADQYAMYVRGLVCRGMTVRCLQDFEEIKKGDVGVVLKVDTEGLHDLNVHVDWQQHASPYWVCFIHIEMLEPPKSASNDKSAITYGSQVRIIKTQQQQDESRRQIGTVVAINNKEILVQFPHQSCWEGSINDVELVNDDIINPNVMCTTQPDGDLIDDWSQCIRSLTVSSNETMAKNLLDRNSNYWQSSNTQGKPWIRLEMHDNVLIHGLSITVNPADCSHMPSLIVIRMGDSPKTLKDYKWVSVKISDVNVSLLNDVDKYYQWIEIVIKHCRNNGIQCRVHSINIIGRHRQTDLDLMLMNASFLASEYDNFCETNNSTATTSLTTATATASTVTGAAATAIPDDKTLSEMPCAVLVWGLNDKEQLGGLKGSKVKLPTFSHNLSQLQPIHIAGGSKSLFIVSQNGKVYACGEGTNGRLGLGHNCNVSTPRQIPVINQYVIKKVAVHSGGKHALALSLDGKVFSWGEGEDGKLGHGNRLTLDKPKLIDALRSKRIRDIACGSSHSAAITSSGELYTWGLGEYGRLGHGDNTTQLKPKLVNGLLGKRVIQVACGSRDAQTLALTEDGMVYSWGDGDFGKLGRGGSEGSSIPHEIDRLLGNGVIQIECGAQFSLALTRNGEVWTWGKGDYYRLGHGSDQHVRKPAIIQGLRGKKIVHVAVGALHCLAVTDQGQVYAWGDNDHGQQGSGTTIVNKKPMQVVGLDLLFVNRVACGSSHSVAWSLPNSQNDNDKIGPVPFSTTKDPLGGNSLSIYDTEPQSSQQSTATTSTSTATTPASTMKTTSNKPSLSETLLSLESYGPKQTALNYVLNAMSILQARQIIVSALTSHTDINGGNNDGKMQIETTTTESQQQQQQQYLLKDHNGQIIIESTNNNNSNVIMNNDGIVHGGGGEGPADASELIINEQSPEIETASNHVQTLNAFQSLTGSLSLSASISSCNAAAAHHRHSRMSASAMSVMAATITNQEEEITPEHGINGLDDFTSLLGEVEAKSLVELLKLSVAGRTGPSNTSQTIANTLIALGTNSPSIGTMILETCITELEDLCTSRYYLRKMPRFVVQESSHPYIDDITLVGNVKIPGAEALRLEFDSQCSTEKRNDPLIIMDGSGRVIAARSGRELVHWAPEIRIQGDEMRWKFTSDSSVNGWGWRFWVHAIMPSSFLQEMASDRAILSQPSMPLVMALLHPSILPNNTSVLLRLASALSACSQLSTLTTAQRIWSLKKLHSILINKHAPKPRDSSLNKILSTLIPELFRQYAYEEPQVRGGIHLMHSDYFKSLAALACDMQLDTAYQDREMHEWSWLRRYCSAVRVAQALIKRTELPRSFCNEVMKKLSEMVSTNNTTTTYGTVVSTTSTTTTTTTTATTTTTSSIPSTSTNSFQSSSQSSSSSLLSNQSNISISHYVDSILKIQDTKTKTTTETQQVLLMHEDHNIFKAEHDRQLLQWLNRRPEDWALSWGGASTIYGWGHNHRGQLGGLEGSRIKMPTPCEALSLLRPIQLAGGEQTLYAVTPDGKLFATGYGAGGRLGIGGVDSVSTPTLVESLQHVFIKKVAVNSGGKHCLALTTDGEVYSWGEGEDGKLGHGNRISVDRPKLIEALSGMGIIDIACGSGHSACITSAGHILTWGKGRYGRLGHGDSEDQLSPKLVEALLGCRAIDIACGSGDAQTLCITDDDNVWSWGDGDYGKLGRGGSDGCKFPMKIESLAGLGVIKVECGSQFSVALTRSGAVYTWGKGDYHRLGHGTADHVRRPKKVAVLYGKKIISIATGSLHCVACSDNGEVYTWGDNDEGQLGDGTVSAIQRPRLVSALQGKHIVKVTCGSAHTLALSTSQLTQGARPLPSPPLEYDLVRDLPPAALHARLVLLYHFSELLCPCLALLPISGELSLSALKDVLVYNIKEAAFRKVIQTTMVRDKQHGPVIELNRIQVKRSRMKSGNGVAGVDGMKSVFGQMVQKLPLLTQEALSLPHRVWKVKFVGESVDDCGGGYSESIAEMCDELQNGSVPLLIPTPNGRGEAGANRDCFLLDPTLVSVLQMNMFRFLGVLMGIAVRTGSPLSLNLAEPVWRQLAGESLRLSDLTEVDRDYVAGLLYIRDMVDDPKIFSTLELPFSTSSAKGHEVPLSTRYTRIVPSNRQEYVCLALNYRLHEFDEQVKAVRDGMSKVIPVPLLSLFSASELQAMVCGSPDIPLNLLKSVATYKGVDPNSSLVQWFWEVMEEFTNQERSLFLRFVWGRTRLPRTIADFRGRDFVLQVLDKYHPPDHFLPESYTCFFLLKMPRYSCKAVLLEKLKYAIHFCKSIDTDEYARVAMGDPAEATGSEDSDLDSVTSHE